MAVIPDKRARDDSAGDTFRDSKKGQHSGKKVRWQTKKRGGHGSMTEEDIWASDGPTNMEEEGDEGIGEATITGLIPRQRGKRMQRTRTRRTRRRKKKKKKKAWMEERRNLRGWLALEGMRSEASKRKSVDSGHLVPGGREYRHMASSGRGDGPLTPGGTEVSLTGAENVDAWHQEAGDLDTECPETGDTRRQGISTLGVLRQRR
ncbi:hypothetical protein BGX38DRAFT_1278128 [Terfezia claveryi]|nr:hypothetical protein BGX38DRAFT_1278128 [Terfezia claveryi]